MTVCRIHGTPDMECNRSHEETAIRRHAETQSNYSITITKCSVVYAVTMSGDHLEMLRISPGEELLPRHGGQMGADAIFPQQRVVTKEISLPIERTESRIDTSEWGRPPACGVIL
jgi:hypothetical protein